MSFPLQDRMIISTRRFCVRCPPHARQGKRAEAGFVSRGRMIFFSAILFLLGVLCRVKHSQLVLNLQNGEPIWAPLKSRSILCFGHPTRILKTTSAV